MRLFQFSVLATLCCLIFGSNSILAQTTFVKTNGTGAGSSWTDAAGDLQQVLAQAQSGDEIWVASGTFYPTSCSNCSTPQRDFAFDIPTGVKLYGGFSGSETSLTQRNLAINITTLSGDIDGDGTEAGNSYHVVTFTNATNQTRIDGFTISGGYANGSNERQHGGGIYNDGSGTGNISTPVIANCAFNGNQATSNGGGIYNNGFFGTSSPEVLNCSFLLNHSREGGAMHNQGFFGESSPTIISCLFDSNSSSAGGAVYNSGNNGISNPRYENCHFVGNHCTGYGGAVYNFAKDAGGECKPLFANCIFDANEGAGAAGAIYTLGSSTADAEPEVVGCVFHDNYSRVGGAVYVNASDNGITHLRISNSIFTASRANFDPILHFSGGSGPIITLEHVQFDATDCNSITGSSGGTLNCGAGLIFNSNAQFVDAANADFHLASGAPGIDAGDGLYFTTHNVLEDIDGNARIQGAAADLGAYEFATGDSDGDGILDSLDNCPFIANPTQVDIDGDGFGASCECDDTDPLINPNATEVCDGVDNNCDLQIDESGGTITYYADGDGDSYGDPLVSTTACNPPAGYVLDNTDCDDADNTTYPGAPELCDGKDNNCNQMIDEGAVDVTPPTISCVALSLTAVPGSTTTITPVDVYGGGSDACSSVTLVSVSPSSFILPGTYTVTLTAEDDAGNQTTCSTTVTITVQTNNGVYCELSASQPWTEWVSNVAFADLDNASGKCGTTCGYSDYTTEVASVLTGNAYDLTLTPGLSYSSYEPDLYWRVWIDWNQDGDFLDAGELVGSANATYAVVTQSVSIPASALPGTTRMRIAMRRNEAPTTCDDYIFGEVEDYTVAIAVGGPQVTIGGCPGSQSLSVLPGNTSATVTWAAPTVSSTCSSGGEIVTQISGPASGSSFPLGTTEIVYAAGDGCGSIDTCRFTISVNSQPAILSINCPANQSIQLTAGQTNTSATWASATATTTCPGGVTITQTAGPSSGASFSVGSTTISYEATDACGNIETCSFIITVHPEITNPGTYCDVEASEPWTEWVTNVAVANLDHASGKCDGPCGYSDFTSEIASVLTGNDYDLTLTPGLSYSSYQPDLYWRAWIDYNQDGDFLDAGELVASIDATFAVITQNITIPVTAAAGTTRMRIAMRRDAAPEVCTNYLYGEVEDYTVAIAAGGPSVSINGCPPNQSLSVLPGNTSAVANWTVPSVSTTCPTGNETIVQVAGPTSGSSFALGDTEITYVATDDCANVDTCRFTISVSAQPALLDITCPTSQSIQLTAGQTDAVATWGAATATTTCPGGASVAQMVGPASGATFSIGVTTISYEATDACGNTETCSFTITVLPVVTNPGTYCISEASQPWTEWIANVAISNIDNASGKCDTRCGYGDFTNLVVALTAGSNQVLTLTPGLSWAGQQADFHWNVWIDWNGDGDFDDAGETVASVQSGSSVATSTIAVPAGASGSTRMRISAREGQDAGPCESYIFGEVEDYSVLITPGTSARQALRGIVVNASSLSLKLYPNPVAELLSISANEEMKQVDLFSATGQRVLSQNLVDQQVGQVDVSDLAPGFYLVEVQLASGIRTTQRVIVE